MDQSRLFIKTRYIKQYKNLKWFMKKKMIEPFLLNESRPYLVSVAAKSIKYPKTRKWK
jgi:hypothetical protein